MSEKIHQLAARQTLGRLFETTGKAADNELVTRFVRDMVAAAQAQDTVTTKTAKNLGAAVAVVLFCASVGFGAGLAVRMFYWAAGW
jgi:hypothetical protein